VTPAAGRASAALTRPDGAPVRAGDLAMDEDAREVAPRWRPGRALYQLPAQEGRCRAGAHHPHRARRRFRTQTGRLVKTGATTVRCWAARQPLRVSLIAILIAPLLVVCATVGIVTTLALRGFLIKRLDQQLTSAGTRYATALEHDDHNADNAETGTLGQASARWARAP